MTDNVRIGLIGCGLQGRNILTAALTTIGGVELVACADLDEAAARNTVQDFGYQSHYVDYREMLSAEEIDAVVIATTNSGLKDAALAAIETGHQVFVEKPVAVNLAGLEQVREAARRAGVTVMVGFCQRYEQARTMAKNLIERGAVGEIVHVKAAKGGGRLEGWKADPAYGGGALLHIGVHITDQIIWMVGSDPARVYAEVDRRPDTGCDSYSASLIRFANGVRADVVSSEQLGGGMDYIEVIGTAGRVKADTPSQTVEVVSDVLPEYSEPTTIRPRRNLTQVYGPSATAYSYRHHDTAINAFTRRAEMYQVQMREWLKALTEKQEPPITLDDAASVLAVTDAVFESGRTGNAVDLT